MTWKEDLLAKMDAAASSLRSDHLQPEPLKPLNILAESLNLFLDTAENLKAVSEVLKESREDTPQIRRPRVDRNTLEEGMSQVNLILNTFSAWMISHARDDVFQRYLETGTDLAGRLLGLYHQLWARYMMLSKGMENTLRILSDSDEKRVRG